MRWNEDTVTGALAGMACLLAAFLVGYGAAHLFTLLLAL